jgi:hypothetical protein
LALRRPRPLETLASRTRPIEAYRLPQGTGTQAQVDSMQGEKIVTIRKILILAMALCVSPMAQAATSGTPEQQAACGPDVRKFCYKLKESDSDDVYLQCLEVHRDELSSRCLNMLKSYGK